MHRTNWLADFGHPSASVDFSLPKGVFFLQEFLPELGEYDDKSLQDRLSIYFWWEAIGARCYPDFTWTLRPQDRACLDAIDDRTFCTSFQRAITFWLRHTDPSALGRPSLMQLLLSSPPDDPEELPKLPYFLHVLLQDRDDLQRHFDLATPTGRLAYLRWWERYGSDEYPRMNWSTSNVVEELSVLETSDGALFPQPKMLNMVWRNRTDLRQKYPLHTLTGQLGYLGWWQEHGAQTYPTLKWSPREVFDDLHELEIVPGTAPVALPRLLNLAWKERQDLHGCLDRTAYKGQWGLVHWWRERGQAEYPAIQWSTYALIEELIAPRPAEHFEGVELPSFLLLVWSEREDLRNAINSETRAGAAAVVDWWNQSGRQEYPLFSLVLIDPILNSEGVSIGYSTRSNILSSTYPFGVNIIGFPQGILGLGEDARMMGHALELATVPHAFINAPMAGPEKVDTSVSRLLTIEPKYRVNVFCLPPPEMMRLALEGGRKLVDSRNYNVGAWPWELPHWPTAFSRIDQFVDEIWAQSRFVQATFRKLGDTPVQHMPMAVEVPEPTERVRGRFRLPERDFLFYLMFDGNSWLTRKNPLAGVQAFQQAFDASAIGVGLVVKAMNIRESDPIWQCIRGLASRDKRIHIVSERLTRQDSINFMASCDAYISLHRSEGFGRVIAEAMLLGQPVVVTNFSGNVDFCDDKTSFLVDGELVPLRAGDYLFSEGQYWCDPDVSIAAEQLRRTVDDAALRERIAEAGKHRITRDYSVGAVAQAYARRLSEIGGKGVA
jgi:glycosyltransferase involved in cell wall biosynthesis